MDPAAPERLSIGRLPRTAWLVIGILALSVTYLALQVAFVRPYLWPAGHGLRLAGDSRFAGGTDEHTRGFARPLLFEDHPVGATIVRDVRPGSPAAGAGVRAGDDVVAVGRPGSARVELSELEMAAPAQQVAAWRDAYRLGLAGDLDVVTSRDGATRAVTLARLPVWRSAASIRGDWWRLHLGMIVQILMFIGAALVLVFVRTTDITACLCALALALSAVGSGGPLMGAERTLPPLAAGVMTVFSWVAGPLAFPCIVLAMLYFPVRSPLIVRRRWLQAIPFLAAGPMIVAAFVTGLYIAGPEAALRDAVIDVTRPNLYFTSFALALAINVIAVAEGVQRYQTLSGALQRRVRLAVFTGVPGVLAFVIKDGLPIAALLRGRVAPTLPFWIEVILQLFILLPTVGITYAVAVQRVLGPRMVLRRSLQYALASRTLTVLGVLPAIALTAALVKNRHLPLDEIVRRAPLLYAVLVAASIAAFKYRDRMRTWLDERFFRKEYDARKILISLAGRVRFETDPDELSGLVVRQIDEALRPRSIAMLTTGVEEGRLTPVARLRTSIEPLALTAGLVSMLRWSDEPLEILLDDPKSGVRRLPAEEQEWLQKAGVALLVPVVGVERSLTAVIALGERLSDEPYTAEDRELLSSIASQMGLWLNVSRLGPAAVGSEDATMARPSVDPNQAVGTPGEGSEPLLDCPTCGRVANGSVKVCPSDGAAFRQVGGVPRVIDRKYRIDERIGRGGMGAIYRARDLRLDRDVAIKIVHAELLNDPDARGRFRREAQLVARLQHPSIVSIFDYGTLPAGGAYLVMELVRGEDLRRVLSREGALPPARAARILSQIGAAIDAAHRAGILHRDLKPENVLLTDGESDVKVLDFGVAKLISENRPDGRLPSSTMLTVDGMVVGTPAYMAPEQLRGQPLDERSDVFSLGVMAFEMMTGDLPFGRGSLAEIALRQARGVPPLRSDAGRSGVITPALEQAVQTALALNPATRPTSPSAFASIVQSAIGL
jgi:serine/threonine-protein kinase